MFTYGYEITTGIQRVSIFLLLKSYKPIDVYGLDGLATITETSWYMLLVTIKPHFNTTICKLK